MIARADGAVARDFRRLGRRGRLWAPGSEGFRASAGRVMRLTRASWEGSAPGAGRPGGLDRGEAGGRHPAFPHEALDPGLVRSRPAALRLARRDELLVALGVDGHDL